MTVGCRVCSVGESVRCLQGINMVLYIIGGDCFTLHSACQGFRFTFPLWTFTTSQLVWPEASVTLRSTAQRGNIPLYLRRPHTQLSWPLTPEMLPTPCRRHHVQSSERKTESCQKPIRFGVGYGGTRGSDSTRFVFRKEMYRISISLITLNRYNITYLSHNDVLSSSLFIIPIIRGLHLVQYHYHLFLLQSNTILIQSALGEMIHSYNFHLSLTVQVSIPLYGGYDPSSRGKGIG